MSTFLIGQEVHEDIHYFSYEMRKGQFFSHFMKDKRKEHAAKPFDKLKHPFQLNMFCFSKMRKISARFRL